MNHKLTTKSTSTEIKGQFPDFPPRDDMNNPLYLYRPGYITTLHRHFGSLDSTLVLSEVPLAWRPSRRRDTLIPDLLVAFAVDTAAIIARKGYAIEEHGKAPDFVLEVASASTGYQDEERKRAGYAAYGVPEYWRFDPSGGAYHRQPLAGDRLVEGAYRPIDIHRTDDTHYFGRSAVLNLSLCWEEGQLRWWDPVAERYLETHDEEAEARITERQGRITERQVRITAEVRADSAEVRAGTAEVRADTAEARVRELEAELRRRESC